MTKIKQHFLPITYLNGFCDKDKQIWTYDKENLNNPWKSPPAATAFVKKLYDFNDVTNSKIKNTIEDFFAENIEGPASELLVDLRREIFPQDNKRESLSLFFAFLLIRSPSYIKHLQNEHDHELNQIIKISASQKQYFHENYEKAGISATYEEIEGDRLAILNGEVSAFLHKNKTLEIMMKLGFILAQHLANMSWSLIKSDGCSFITSDNLLTIINSPTLGLSKNAGIFIPISPSLGLLLINNKSFRGNQLFNVKKDYYDSLGNKINLKKLIKELNKNTARHSSRFIYFYKNCEKIKRMINNLSSHNDRG